MNFIKLFLRIFSLCSEETLLHKGVILSLFWKLNLAMIMYTDNTTVNKHPKNFQQWWLLFVTLFCMLWCRGCCSVVPCFLTFITLGWKEMERTRHGEREQTMGMRSCLVEVVLLQFPSLPESPSLSPVVFPGQLYLLFQLCVRVHVYELEELHCYPLPFPWTHTHTHTHTLIMNRSVCMAAQWGSVGMLLLSNYVLFKVSGKLIWIT